MMNPSDHALDYIRAVVHSVEEAGRYAKHTSRESYEKTDKPFQDVVTSTDYECERIILKTITNLYSDHTVISEESGQLGGDSDWKWIVDPLDGTHNFITGIPLFGVIVTLFHENEPIAAILHDAWQADTVIGAARHGVFMNEKQLKHLDDSLSPNTSTIGWTQGYAVQDDPVARSVRNTAEAATKRLLATWSPVIDSIRVLTGHFGAIVSYDGEITDLSAARVLVPELGGKVERFSRKGEDRRFIVGRSNIVDHLAQVIGEIPEL